MSIDRRRFRRRSVPRPVRLQREWPVLPADPARAGAAQHRRRAHPSEPDHPGPAVPRPAGVSRAVPALHPTAARPAAAAGLVDTAGAAAAVAQPAASAATPAVPPAAGAPHPAGTVDPWPPAGAPRPWRAAGFNFEERPPGETVRKKVRVFLRREINPGHLVFLYTPFCARTCTGSVYRVRMSCFFCVRSKVLVIL